MSLRKFISGVSALAVAASAFAAMAVTASAKNYEPTDITPERLVYASDKGNGIYRTRDNQNSGYSAVVADLSTLPHITDATEVKVNFKAKIPAGNGSFGKLMYGVGDKATRKLTGANSSAGNYNKAGLITYFGSEDGTNFIISDHSTNYNTNQAGNKEIDTEITFNREEHEYTCKIKIGDVTVTSSSSTSEDNLTVIEAFTWGAQAFDLTFKDITVSYTVPDVIVTPGDSEVYTQAGGYDEDVAVGIFDLEILADSYELSRVKYNGQSGIPTPSTVLSGGNARIAVVINGATSTDALNSVVFE